MHSPSKCEIFSRSKLCVPVGITSVNSALYNTVYLYVSYELRNFSLVAVQFKSGQGRLLTRFLDHIQLDTNIWCDSSEQLTISSQKPLLTQHTVKTRDQHSCHRQDSNPRSPTLSGLRPTP